MKLKDYTGQRYGRLVVIGEPYRKHATSNSSEMRTYIRVRCDCGNEKDVSASTLTRTPNKSCGCYQKENPNGKTHGLSGIRLHRIWKLMRNRCHNTKSSDYKNYGGRGISICEEWKNDFMSFYTWAINNGHKASLSIDRINNNGNYEPGNCRWATDKIQARNKRTVKMTELRAKHIRILYRAWSKERSRDKLAYLYGVKLDVIKRIVSNRTWV